MLTKKEAQEIAKHFNKIMNRIEANLRMEISTHAMFGNESCLFTFKEEELKYKDQVIKKLNHLGFTVEDRDKDISINWSEGDNS